MFKILSQCFIMIGYLIFFVSRFSKNKKSILIKDNLSRSCFIIGYAFLRSINGIEHTVYGIIRNVVGQSLNEKKKKYKIIGFITMLILLCVMYGVSFNNTSTLLLILSGIINLTAIMFYQAQGIRLGTVLASICNVIAFVIIESYISVIGEVLCGIMGVISYIKEKLKTDEYINQE